MPYNREDFYKPLLDHLQELDAQQPVSQNDPRRAVFNYFLPPAASPNLQCQYNPNCWAKHLPLFRICWHDTYVDPSGNRDQFNNPSSIGNGVMITKRHLLAFGHGKEVDGYEQVWTIGNQGNPVDTFAIRTIDAVKGIYPGEISFADDGGGFHVLYLERDIDPNYITPLILPSDLPEDDMNALPLLGVDQFQDANIYGMVDDPRKKASILIASLSSVLIDPFYRPERGIAGRMFKVPVLGDSGTPLFLMYKNSQLYFMGALQSGSGVDLSGQAIVYPQYYEQIVEACKILNKRHGEVPAWVPATKHCVNDPRASHNRCGYRQPAPGPLG